MDGWDGWMERLDSMDARSRDSERQIMENLESIVVRIKGLEGHLELLSQGHLAIATGNEDRHSDRYAPVAAAIAKSSKGKNDHLGLDLIIMQPPRRSSMHYPPCSISSRGNPRPVH